MTKDQIDALVAALPTGCDGECVQFEGAHVTRKDCITGLYLAAGLTAEGKRKPERVRMWRGKSQWTGNFVWFEREPKPGEFHMTDLTPGWFVPDGAE